MAGSTPLIHINSTCKRPSSSPLVHRTFGCNNRKQQPYRRRETARCSGEDLQHYYERRPVVNRSSEPPDERGHTSKKDEESRSLLRSRGKGVVSSQAALKAAVRKTRVDKGGALSRFLCVLQVRGRAGKILRPPQVDRSLLSWVVRAGCAWKKESFVPDASYKGEGLFKFIASNNYH